jgi:hypothetical protein
LLGLGHALAGPLIGFSTAGGEEIGVGLFGRLGPAARHAARESRGQSARCQTPIQSPFHFPSNVMVLID